MGVGSGSGSRRLGGLRIGVGGSGVLVCLAVNLLIRLSNAPFSNISLCPRGVRASIPQKGVRKADEKVITTVL